jgi:3-oxoacyl-[acyl-carrier-protein] synthase II
VGNTAQASWKQILAGQSGIDAITHFDASAFACHFAGEVKNFNLDEYISSKDARTMDRFIHLGVAAGLQAVADAGLPTGEALNEETSFRIGCLIGSGIGGLPLIETVNTFGASSHPESKHFADQRELYQAQKTKVMTLDKDEVIKNAEKIYHPE